LIQCGEQTRRLLYEDNAVRRFSDLIIESSYSELADFSGRAGKTGELCRASNDSNRWFLVPSFKFQVSS
jgi:hypothetical protein